MREPHHADRIRQDHPRRQPDARPRPRSDIITLPNLYLIGAPKAGTTSVASWLEQHPDVFWSVPKEPFHWASDFPAQRALYGFDSRAAYENLYASAEARSATFRGDGSTTYLYSATAVPDILAEVPDARFIVCVRDPSALVVSYHRTQLLALNEDETDFATAWARSRSGGLPGVATLDPKLVDYPRIGRMGAAMEALMEVVPTGRLHVVLFDDLAADPAAVYAAMLSFLGLDTSVTADFAAENASEKMFRSAALRRLTHRPPAVVAPVMRRLRQWSRTTDARWVRGLKRRMWRAEARPEVSEATSAELRAFFHDDVVLLETLIGRDLERWPSRATAGS